MTDSTPGENKHPIQITNPTDTAIELFGQILSSLDTPTNPVNKANINTIQQQKNYVTSLKNEVIKMIQSPLSHTDNPLPLTAKKPKGTTTRSQTAKRVSNEPGHAQQES